MTIALQGLCEARTVQELIELVHRAESMQAPEIQFARRIHHVLRQASNMAEALSQYQREETLGNRVEYLLEAAIRVEKIQPFYHAQWTGKMPKTCLERNAVELSLSQARRVISK